MEKAISLEESISGLNFFDKEFFVDCCRKIFPQKITVKFTTSDLNGIIPLYVATIKLKLKGFVVVVYGKKAINQKFCKNLELNGIPDVEHTPELKGFILSVEKPKNKFDINVTKMNSANRSAIKKYQKYLNAGEKATVNEIVEKYLSETKIALTAIILSEKQLAKFSLLFNGDAKDTYLLLVKDQPKNLFSSATVCKILGFSIARYLTAIRKLFELELIMRKGDIFIPLYNKIIAKDNDKEKVLLDL